MVVVTLSVAQAQSGKNAEYVLGPGDILHITVFQNPDLTTDTRVSEVGTLSFPLVGSVPVGGLSLSQGEKKIADMLREGGFVQKPQVNILPVQIRSSQVAVLGQVNRAGRYPLETVNTHLSDMLATAGGIATTGADTVVLMGSRDGHAIRREIDIPALFLKGDSADDIVLRGGDVLYVNRAPVFYIYGEVQHPGAFRLEREMTVMQGLATGGGVTLRGTEKGLRLHRRDAQGRLQIIEPKLDDPLKADDVIYVRESLF
jgi:polysaccharide export outer membrane protein